MFAKVLNSYLRALRLIGPFLSIHVFFRLVSAGILVPLIGIIAGVAISFSGQTALTDQDIVRFLVTPAGALGGLTVVSLLIVSAILDVALMTAVVRSGVLRPVAALQTAAGFGLRSAAALMKFAASLLMRVLVIVIPFLAFAAAVALLMLREFDINYYLAVKPPSFLIAAALIAAAGVILVLVLIRQLSAWAVALHLVLFDGKPTRLAFTESAQRMRGERAGLVGRVGLWLAVRIGVSALVAFLAAVSLAALPDLFGRNLRLIAGVLIMVMLLWALIDLVISAVANGALANLLSSTFDHSLEGGRASSDVCSRVAMDWKSPVATGLIAVSGLSLVSIAGGGVLLGNVGVDSEVVIIAHRGAAGSRPENTRAAVEKAIEDGADWVEIDVQETADGHVAVVHDSDFMKAAGVNLKVWDATVEDLDRIDIGSRFDPAYADQRTPLLGDVLAAAKGRVRVIVELKYYGHDVDLENRVVELVEKAGMADQIATMSLKYSAVRKMRELRPGWRTGVLAATSIGNLSGLEADFLAVNLGEVSPRLLSRAEAAGKDVYAWTVNDPVTISRMISMGVDGLITDEPGLASEVIEYRASLDAPARLMLWISDRFSLALGINDADEVQQ
ncbi:MAG TPA: glycerophosphodiester phosphodiesterase [Wenzhouxiangellaceae bacterium]|nr:glycerophosphodiester phosphodiesterase [Wenzhouxiangellaceae bacterium]